MAIVTILWIAMRVASKVPWTQASKDAASLGELRLTFTGTDSAPYSIPLVVHGRTAPPPSLVP